MNKEQIYSACCKFREAICKTPKSLINGLSSLAVSKFPDGCCDASKILASYLFNQLNIICDYFDGEGNGRENNMGSHAWLEYCG